MVFRQKFAQIFTRVGNFIGERRKCLAKRIVIPAAAALKVARPII